MQLDDFLWLPEIVDKLARKHRLTQDEVEEVFFDRPRYRYVEAGLRTDEDVYAALGQTEAGRYVVVFFVAKLDRTALIVTARDMDRGERRLYDRA